MKNSVFYYRIVPHNGSAVFARKERAEEIARIQTAMQSAKEWGEFRSLMPQDAYSDLLEVIQDCGGELPAPGTPFDCALIPGFCDGDYPPWLQVEMDALLPAETLRRFGTREHTSVNGSFWNITSEAAEALAEHLRSQGFVVLQMQDLPFH